MSEMPQNHIYKDLPYTPWHTQDLYVTNNKIARLDVKAGRHISERYWYLYDSVGRFREAECDIWEGKPAQQKYFTTYFSIMYPFHNKYGTVALCAKYNFSKNQRILHVPNYSIVYPERSLPGPLILYIPKEPSYYVDMDFVANPAIQIVTRHRRIDNGLKLLPVVLDSFSLPLQYDASRQSITTCLEKPLNFSPEGEPTSIPWASLPFVPPEIPLDIVKSLPILIA